MHTRKTTVRQGTRADAPRRVGDTPGMRDHREREGETGREAIRVVTTDAEIVRLSLARPSEFAALFDRHAAAVGHYARRLVGVDVGDDVLSETFLVAFRRRADFDGECDSALPWLLGIATRLAHRARAAEAKRWRALQASARVAVETAISDIDAAAERADAASRLRALVPRIRRMSDADRDTLLLYAWGDLSTEEIAVALGVPVGTVWSRLNRIRRRLRSEEPPPSRPDDRHAASGGEGESDGSAHLRA